MVIVSSLVILEKRSISDIDLVLDTSLREQVLLSEGRVLHAIPMTSSLLIEMVTVALANR